MAYFKYTIAYFKYSITSLQLVKLLMKLANRAAYEVAKK